MGRPRTDIAPRIVAAAATLFAETGVEATSLRSIAKRADTSIGMVYYYFPTKDDLFFAVVEEVYAKLLDEVTQLLQSQGTFQEKLGAMYARLGGLRPEERPILRLVALEAISGSPRFPRLVERFKRGHVSLLFQLAAEGVHAGVFRQDLPPFVIVASIVAMGTLPQVFLEVAGAHLSFLPLLPREQLVGALTDALLHGIQKAPMEPLKTTGDQVR